MELLSNDDDSSLLRVILPRSTNEGLELNSWGPKRNLAALAEGGSPILNDCTCVLGRRLTCPHVKCRFKSLRGQVE